MRWTGPCNEGFAQHRGQETGPLIGSQARRPGYRGKALAAQPAHKVQYCDSKMRASRLNQLLARKCWTTRKQPVLIVTTSEATSQSVTFVVSLMKGRIVKTSLMCGDDAAQS